MNTCFLVYMQRDVYGNKHRGIYMYTLICIPTFPSSVHWEDLEAITQNSNEHT